MDEAVDETEEHGLARSAAAHHDQPLALVETEADPLQHFDGLEALVHVIDFHDRALGRHRAGQKRMRKSFVRKKSEMMTPIVTCTTVAVVARPSPSVPPSVLRPL